MNRNTIKVVSFNCKSVKRSVEHVRQLCLSSDIIALQETWLLPDDISFLNDINKDFGSTGTSAVDTAAGMLRGRPHGGVALLWNKHIFQNVSIVKCGNPRVCAIEVSMGPKSFLVFSVYMPTDKLDNLVDFTNCLGLVSAIIGSYSTESIYILGDFNAHPTELFFNELISFCSDEQWTCADVDILGLQSGTYTFISEAHGSKRWLDHCVATKSAFRSIVNVFVKYDVGWSDHFPLIVECNIDVIKSKIFNENKIINRVIWGNRNTEQIDDYR